MRQKSKIKNIVDSFSGKVDVTPEQWEYRLKECEVCPFNSINTDNKELTLIEVSRKNLFPNKPFCRGCGCNIDEKTSQATEQCAAGKFDQPLRWNRLKVEITDKTGFNIFNNTSDLVNISLSGDGKYYEIDYGTVDREFDSEINFQLFVSSQDKLDIEYFKPSCGACTTSSCEKVSDTHYNCSVVLKVSKTGKGKEFSKRIWVKYKINQGKYSRVKIELKGKIK